MRFRGRRSESGWKKDGVTSVARLFGDAHPPMRDPWLHRALELAERGRGATAPNPIVGCVIVAEGRVVGEGFHPGAGGPHAEVEALRAAGEAAREATAYVTLEPCTHHGKTPPCTDALIAGGLARVVIGMPDPNPRVSGRGADALAAARIKVEFARDPSPFTEQLREWVTFVTSGRPHVRAKVALTLDGHPALAVGARSQLTGQGAQELTMRLRRTADAVLVGAGTVAVDDPSLTVREPDGAHDEHQPKRVVLVRTTTPPPEARLFHDGHGPVIVLQPEETDADPRIESSGAHVLTYPVSDGLGGALARLAEADVVDLLVEPGPRLFTALWEEDLLDDLVFLHAGGVAGDGAPPLFVGESEPDTSTLVRRMSAFEAGCAGSDAVSVWRRRPREEAT